MLLLCQVALFKFICLFAATAAYVMAVWIRRPALFAYLAMRLPFIDINFFVILVHIH